MLTILELNFRNNDEYFLLGTIIFSNFFFFLETWRAPKDLFLDWF